MLKNVIVAQSGGPSPVINNSLRGVIDACMEHPSALGKIYGAQHGIEGVLKEKLLDISAQDQHETRLLKTTPAAGAIGTCRYKLKANQAHDFARLIEVMKAHDIGYFFYIGGNDSMDTADKINTMAAANGLDLAVTGVPKTIDNDIGDPEFKLIDHTPGYGSAARYWACCIQNANEENAGSCPADPVLVTQIMGRKTGFITAAARLADPRREMPLLIVMPESGLTMEQLADSVNDMLKQRGRCIVALSEGFDVGNIGAAHDSFGHVEFGACRSTAQRELVNFLNKKGLATRGLARGQSHGTDQRSSMVYASTVDLDEAYQLGFRAVEIALKDGGGWMSTILRKLGRKYTAFYDKVPLRLVANSERPFPEHWLSGNRTDVTDDFISYAMPLIGTGWTAIPLEKGLQRFARFKPIFAERKCRAYIPEANY